MTRIIHDSQRRPVISRRDPIEVVIRPVERARRPLEGLEGLRMGNTLAQEPVAQFDECFAAVHGYSHRAK